ncbi:glycosyltransferase family 4 protein [Christiangramia sp. OXR-203]|jgi:glycosyltransferase involved in cell wall biosynthesis|uniref:glycosyltransferase family 4 protein n=1 Tax=Christiangramia sp. OXR-203 TaxID=3100176 RepID=UPI002AC8F10A|nr:glycosyltransferase family 4 protein [Christiangramia sp. OXR-203]WPY97894.1 glycosyltransferase family 4 protein [Christiangramia sp. OXR-203]
MHIAFLTPEYPDLPDSNSGGLGTSIKNLATALNGFERIKVSIIVYDQKKDHFFQKNNLNFHLVAKKNYAFGGWYRYRKYLEKTINDLAVKENIDIIEAADWTGITAFMNLEVPLLIRLHGSDAYFCDLEGRKQKWKNHWFEKKSLRNADHIVSVSDFTGKKTMQIFGLDRTYHVIPNGIDAEKFKASTKTPKTKQLLYFGSLIRKKGFLKLAEIFNLVVLQNPETKLVIAGKDVTDFQVHKSTWEVFQSILIPEAVKNVRYLGQVDYQSIIGLLEESTVVVLPSFAEAFPMTWLEAMAMEKAMVTSNIGWANEIMVQGETGFMEHPQDHIAFAQRILKLLEDENLRKRMGLRARNKIQEEFRSSIIAGINLNYYKKVLKRSTE